MDYKNVLSNVFVKQKSIKLLAIALCSMSINVQAERHQNQLSSMTNAPIAQAPVTQLNPQQLLEQSLAKVMYFLSQPSPKDNDAVTNFVISEIAPNFDLRYMARWVAGRYFPQMSAQQKQAFLKDFSETFITNMVKKIVNFSQTPPTIGDFRSKQVGENEAIVATDVYYGQQVKILVEFRYLRTRIGWRAVDVKANGMSALMHYRNLFAAQLRSQRY